MLYSSKDDAPQKEKEKEKIMIPSLPNEKNSASSIFHDKRLSSF